MKNSMRKLILVGCLFSPLAFADEAPVESITAATSSSSAPIATAAPTQPALTLDQRVAVLERQISTMNQIDLVNQMTHLEQQVQDLEGQVQVLSHTLQTAQAQSTSQYADLDKRLQNASVKTPAPVASAPAVPAVDTAAPEQDEQTLYDAAYKNIKEQKNAEGIEGMKKYLTQYPNGKYAASAHYWLGQLYILKGDNKSIKQAVSEFDIVIKKYPKSDKVKESNLKLGFAYLLQNKNQAAKAQFHKVMKEYPGSSTAQLAEARLAQLSS